MSIEVIECVKCGEPTDDVCVFCLRPCCMFCQCDCDNGAFFDHDLANLADDPEAGSESR